MAKLDPNDDYVDTGHHDGADFVGVLRKKVTPAVRAWVAGSSCRSMSPNEQVLARARVETVASSGDGKSYLSRSELRPPRGKEIGRWFLAIYAKDTGRAIYILPEGFVVRALAVANDKSLEMSIAIPPDVARQLAVPTKLDLALPCDAVTKLPTQLRPKVPPVNAILAIVRLGGIPARK
jgi:hypothetical protein